MMKPIVTSTDGTINCDNLALNLCLSIKANNAKQEVILIADNGLHVETAALIRHFFDHVLEAYEGGVYLSPDTIILPSKPVDETISKFVFSPIGASRLDVNYINFYYRAFTFHGETKTHRHLIAYYNQLSSFYRVYFGVKQVYNYAYLVQNHKQDRPIYVYWHICCMNHYKEVIAEQLNAIKESGLYDACSKIYVGVAADDSNMFQDICELLGAHHKIRVRSMGIMQDFEFTTLKVLQSDCNKQPPFFGVYLHTKGVSYADKKMGEHWRRYLNYYVIDKWRNCQKSIRNGYDLCGVKLLEAGHFPMHYSGNFWHFDSEYIKMLVPIDSLNLKNRYDAEMWVCSATPLADSLCNLMIDHFNHEPFK